MAHAPTNPLWHQLPAHVDLYAILGLDTGADDAAVQRAWRRTARSAHPDAGGDPETFRLVHVAYLVLGDAEQRRAYDRWRVLRAARPPEARDIPPEPHVKQEPARRLAVGLLLIALACVLLAYLVPAATILIGAVVGVVVLARYVRHWRHRALPW